MVCSFRPFLPSFPIDQPSLGNRRQLDRTIYCLLRLVKRRYLSQVSHCNNKDKGKRGEKNIRLNSTNLTKLLLRILRRDRRGNNNIITGQPVNRASDTILISRLERINHTEHLGSVPARRSRVRHDQTDLLSGVNDEDGADGESHALGVDVGGVLVVDHVVGVGNLALGVGDDGELEVGAVDLVDVLDPGLVGLGAVGAQADELDAALGELRLELGEGAELGGADGGEVILYY